MTLRLRLLGALVIVSLVSLGTVLALGLLQGRRQIAAELDAAMAVGWATTVRAVTTLPATRRTPAQVAEIIRLFDGNRHVRARLIAGSGAVVGQSVPPRRHGVAPVWFVRLVADPARNAGFDLGPLGTIDLTTTATAAADEVFAVLGVAIVGVAVFFGLSLGIALYATARLSRPLQALGTGFSRIGSGDYRARVIDDGPGELADLLDGFNQMAERLDDMRLRNRRLAGQLAAIQDEERTELARNLHDDIGPYLFAIDVDATTIEASLERAPDDPQRDAEIADRAKAIRGAIGHVKKHVRAILGQLRPGAVVQLGLSHIIHDLAAFWRDRHPSIRFTIDVPEPGFGDEVDVALSTVVREAVSNAVKHGRPSLIDIAIDVADGEIRLRVADDGGGLKRNGSGGFGIVGMRERITALGGRLTVDQRVDVAGVAVSARVPLLADAARTRPEGP